jgi:hypothetical protein
MDDKKIKSQPKGIYLIMKNKKSNKKPSKKFIKQFNQLTQIIDQFLKIRNSPGPKITWI